MLLRFRFAFVTCIKTRPVRPNKQVSFPLTPQYEAEIVSHPLRSLSPVLSSTPSLGIDQPSCFGTAHISVYSRFPFTVLHTLSLGSSCVPLQVATDLWRYILKRLPPSRSFINLSTNLMRGLLHITADYVLSASSALLNLRDVIENNAPIGMEVVASNQVRCLCKQKVDWRRSCHPGSRISRLLHDWP